MKVLVVDYLVRMPEATKIMKLFHQKKHRDMGYFFQLDDLGRSIFSAQLSFKGTPKVYNESLTSPQMHEAGYRLRVYRTIPDR